MSYLVLALGVFLSFCGAFAFYTGYGIIQVERGWASVIAGSVAFSCGVVTLALGLILHRLTRLPAFLNIGRRSTPLRELAWRTPRAHECPELRAGCLRQQTAVPPPARRPSAKLAATPHAFEVSRRRETS